MRFTARTLFIAVIAAAGLLAPASAGAGRSFSVPTGFRVSTYASGFPGVTAMAFGPKGRLYIAQQGGTIVELGSRRRLTIAGGLAAPLGIAWYRNVLYASYTGRIAALHPSADDTRFALRVVVSGLPTGRHQNDGLAFDSGWMYVGIGSTCNACAEANPRSAAIMRFHPNGSGGQIFARGLRNPYGLAVRPRTQQLYADDNGRDDVGDLAPDELNRIVRGGNYGWPSCWGRGGGSNCAGTIAPVALLEPHAAVGGLVFYGRSAFPARYRGDAFVAEWGQDVGGTLHGHKVVDVHFGRAGASVSSFVTGLDHPLALAVTPNGKLLIGDYGTGVIWQVSATG